MAGARAKPKKLLKGRVSLFKVYAAFLRFCFKVYTLVPYFECSITTGMLIRHHRCKKLTGRVQKFLLLPGKNPKRLLRNRHALRQYFQTWPNFVLHENAKHNRFHKTAAAKHAGCARAFNVPRDKVLGGTASWTPLWRRPCWLEKSLIKQLRRLVSAICYF